MLSKFTIDKSAAHNEQVIEGSYTKNSPKTSSRIQLAKSKSVWKKERGKRKI